MDLNIYGNLTKKIRKIVDKNGTIRAKITNRSSQPKLKMALIRGNDEQKDFFTLISDNSKHYNGIDTTTEVGFAVSGQQEWDNLVSFCKTYIARFCLSINKFDKNLMGGALDMIPLVDLSKPWTDEELMVEFGITEAEYTEIRRVIPSYYDGI